MPYLSAFGRSYIIYSTILPFTKNIFYRKKTQFFNLKYVNTIQYIFCVFHLHILSHSWFRILSIFFTFSFGYVLPESPRCHNPPPVSVPFPFVLDPPAPLPRRYEFTELPDFHKSDHNFSFHPYFSFFQTFSHPSIQ